MKQKSNPKKEVKVLINFHEAWFLLPYLFFTDMVLHKKEEFGVYGFPGNHVVVAYINSCCIIHSTKGKLG